MAKPIHIHIHRNTKSVERAIERIDTKLDKLIQQGVHEMQELDDLTAKVAAQGTVIDSAKTLLTGLAQMVRDTQPTKEAIAALAAQIDQQTLGLSQAVVDNTV